MDDSPGACITGEGKGEGGVVRGRGLDMDESVILTGDNRQSILRVLTVKRSVLLSK